VHATFISAFVNLKVYLKHVTTFYVTKDAENSTYRNQLYLIK